MCWRSCLDCVSGQSEHGLDACQGTCARTDRQARTLRVGPRRRSQRLQTRSRHSGARPAHAGLPVHGALHGRPDRGAQRGPGVRDVREGREVVDVHDAVVACAARACSAQAAPGRSRGGAAARAAVIKMRAGCLVIYTISCRTRGARGAPVADSTSTSKPKTRRRSARCTSAAAWFTSAQSSGRRAAPRSAPGPASGARSPPRPLDAAPRGRAAAGAPAAPGAMRWLSNKTQSGWPPAGAPGPGAMSGIDGRSLTRTCAAAPGSPAPGSHARPVGGREAGPRGRTAPPMTYTLCMVPPWSTNSCANAGTATAPARARPAGAATAAMQCAPGAPHAASGLSTSGKRTPAAASSAAVSGPSASTCAHPCNLAPRSARRAPRSGGGWPARAPRTRAAAGARSARPRAATAASARCSTPCSTQRSTTCRKKQNRVVRGFGGGAGAGRTARHLPARAGAPGRWPTAGRRRTRAARAGAPPARAVRPRRRAARRAPRTAPARPSPAPAAPPPAARRAARGGEAARRPRARLPQDGVARDRRAGERGGAQAREGDAVGGRQRQQPPRGQLPEAPRRRHDAHQQRAARALARRHARGQRGQAGRVLARARARASAGRRRGRAFAINTPGRARTAGPPRLSSRRPHAALAASRCGGAPPATRQVCRSGAPAPSAAALPAARGSEGRAPAPEGRPCAPGRTAGPRAGRARWPCARGRRAAGRARPARRAVARRAPRRAPPPGRRPRRPRPLPPPAPPRRPPPRLRRRPAERRGPHCGARARPDRGLPGWRRVDAASTSTALMGASPMWVSGAARP